MGKPVEPDWYADDFDSWGDPDEWPPDWHLKATAALIRHFSQIDLTVQRDANGWSVKLPGQSTWQPSHLRTGMVETTAYLDGFLKACEAMASQWKCRERNEED